MIFLLIVAATLAAAVVRAVTELLSDGGDEQLAVSWLIFAALLLIALDVGAISRRQRDRR
jgi:hypothetical protein